MSYTEVVRAFLRHELVRSTLILVTLISLQFYSLDGRITTHAECAAGYLVETFDAVDMWAFEGRVGEWLEGTTTPEMTDISSETSDRHSSPQSYESDTIEGDTVEGDTVEGDTVEGDSVEGG
eukprot:98511_1